MFRRSARCGRSARRFADALRVGLELRQLLALLFEQAGAAHHDRKRVVQLVRHAGQEAAHRAQLFALAQRLALALDLARRVVRLGHVDQRGGVERGAAHVGAPQHHLDRKLGAVRAQCVQLHAQAEHARRFAVRGCAQAGFVHRLETLGHHQVARPALPSTSARLRSNIASAED
jgi:hypothetical protein